MIKRRASAIPQRGRPIDTEPDEAATPAWRRDDLLPRAPLDAPFGYWRDGVAHACAPETLDRAVRLDANWVWTPFHPRLVPAAEVPELHDALRAQLQAGARQQLKRRAVRGLPWLLIGVVQWLSPFVASKEMAWIVVALGVIPFIGALVRQRMVARAGPRFFAREAETSRFATWLARQRTRLPLALAAVMVATFALQWVTDFDGSIEACGLRRDLVEAGDGWRLLTVAFLHGGLLHAFFNLLVLWVWGRELAALAGTPRFLLCFALSVVGASLASIGWQAEHIAIGASGGISGLLGFQIALAWRRRDQLPSRFLHGVLATLALNALLGFIGRGFIDNAAHVGGLVTGFLLGLASLATARTLPIPVGRLDRVLGVGAGALLAAAAAVTVRRLLSP